MTTPSFRLFRIWSLPMRTISDSTKIMPTYVMIKWIVRMLKNWMTHMPRTYTTREVVISFP